MICPVDQKPIDFFVPDYTLRQYCTAIKSRLGVRPPFKVHINYTVVIVVIQARNFGLDLNNEYELDGYNTKFYRQSSDWVIRNTIRHI